MVLLILLQTKIFCIKILIDEIFLHQKISQFMIFHINVTHPFIVPPTSGSKVITKYTRNVSLFACALAILFRKASATVLNTPCSGKLDMKN